MEKNIVPFRLINGVSDPLSGIHMADRFKEVVPKADIILLDKSSHYPHIETQDLVLQAVHEFQYAL